MHWLGYLVVRIVAGCGLNLRQRGCVGGRGEVQPQKCAYDGHCLPAAYVDDAVGPVTTPLTTLVENWSNKSTLPLMRWKKASAKLLFSTCKPAHDKPCVNACGLQARTFFLQSIEHGGLVHSYRKALHVPLLRGIHSISCVWGKHTHACHQQKARRNEWPASL